MRLALLALCTSMLLWIPARANESPTPSRVPLKGADCLDPSAARDWQEIDSRQLLVDAGRRKYRITLTTGCLDVANGSTLVFEGDPVSGRVCGNFGDKVRFTSGTCRIEQIELIDADAYRAALAGEKPGTDSED